MKTNARKILAILFLALLIIGFTSETTFAETPEKSILIITDELDFSTISNLDTEEKLSLGLMNIRVEGFFNKNQESFFMSLASSRRVKLEEGLFQGIEKTPDGKLKIQGYDHILQGLDDNYKNFSEEMDFLGQAFAEEDIGVGYIGNDESSLLAADKEGIISKGVKEVNYDIGWLEEQSQEILKDTDLLILSYDIDNEPERVRLLEEYINEYSNCNIMVFPKNISGDVKDIRNFNLAPFLQHSPDQEGGILTSLSTKREGIIINLDLFPHLASFYDIPLKTTIGQNIYPVDQSLSQEEIIDSNQQKLNESLNATIIKYIFHGLIIIIQLYIFYNMLRLKKREDQHYFYLIQGVFIAIFLSLLLGFFSLKQSIILYCSLIIGLTLWTLAIKKRKNIISWSVFPIATNILLLWGIYFSPGIIYNSFYGFNNIVSGGRFYGLNNETMGILLATSIITFFIIKEKINNKYLSTLVLLLYFPLVIFALTGEYGSNFGGFLTSIVLFFMLIYFTFLKNVTSRKDAIIAVTIGVGIFLLSFFVDAGGHAGSFFSRVEILGNYEFIDMIGKKLGQLLITAISPPWSIIFIAQLYFIKRIIQEKSYHFTHEMLIILMSALLAFTLNDTGVTSFVYMVTYLIGLILLEGIGEEKDKGTQRDPYLAKEGN